MKQITLVLGGPILIDKSNTIIAGHGRLSAAQLLGIERVPTIRLEGLSEDQIRAYILADNKLAECAGWDESILAIELQHLLTVDLGFEVTVTGFEVPEIDLLVGYAATEPDSVAETQPAVSGPAVSQPGDLWLLGKHSILCADALQESSFATLMEDQKADVVFVDPPYNVAIDGHVSGNGSIRHREFEMASGEMTEGEFVQFLSTGFGLLSLHSKADSVHFAVWIGDMPENSLLPARAPMKVFSICVSGPRTRAVWGLSTGLSTNSSSYSGMAKPRIATMFSLANSVGTEPPLAVSGRKHAVPPRRRRQPAGIAPHSKTRVPRRRCHSGLRVPW